MCPWLAANWLRARCLVCVILAAGGFHSTEVAAAESKRVILLHSFGPDFKPWSDYATNIRSELRRQSPWPLDIIDHSLVTARSNDERSEAPFVEYLRELYATHPPDLIVGIGAPAAVFVQRHRQQLFAQTPMVLTAVEVRRIQAGGLTANDVVVPVRTDHVPVIENILRLLPDTKRVAVVIGVSPGEKFWRRTIASELSALGDRVELIWYDELSFEDILKHASSLPPHSAIFWETISVDAAGVAHEGAAELAGLHAVARAPIFSHDESLFGNTTVGGPMTSVLEVSRATANVAVRIMRGEQPGEIKVAAIGWAAPKFDWREMQRWGIPESRLPAGSEILFRPPTPWEQYRWQIVLIAGVLLLQTCLLVVLFYERRRRHAAELEIRHRMAELAHVSRQVTVGELSASLAHELSQPLGATMLNLAAAKTVLSATSPNLSVVTNVLADIRRDTERASDIIRYLRTLLKKRPLDSERIDLNATCREVLELLSAQARMHGISFVVDFGLELPPWEGNRTELQQVLVNLVLNGMDAIAQGKNGGARRITVATTRSASEIEIRVSDTGPGIDPDKLTQIFEPFFTTKAHGMGMGLSIARKIVEAHHGRIRAAKSSQGGAVFLVSLPFATRRAEGRPIRERLPARD